MSAEIVGFPKAPHPEASRLIWVCGCGCTTFELHADDTVECASCGHTMLDGCCTNWMRRLPAATSGTEVEDLSDANFRVTNLDDPRGLLRRAVKAIDIEETEALVVITKDGAVKTSGPSLDNPERVAWMTKKLKQALDLFLKARPDFL